MDSPKEPDFDFERLQSSPADFEDNFEYGMSCLARRTIFAHLLFSMREIHGKLNSI